MCAKEIEAQTAEAAVINNLSKVKKCDKIHARKSKNKNGMKPHSVVKIPLGKM